MCWQRGTNWVDNTICSRSRLLLEGEEQIKPWLEAGGVCEGSRAVSKFLPALPSSPGRYYCRALSTGCYCSILFLHRVWNQPRRSWWAVKALHGFPEGCVPHPQVEMQPHSTSRTSKNLQRICRSCVNDSQRAHLIHFLHLSKHLLVFFYLSHKASAISVPVSVSLPLVPVILPADSSRTLNTLAAPFRLPFHFIFTWALTAVRLRPQGQLTSLTNAELTQCWNLCPCLEQHETDNQPHTPRFTQEKPKKGVLFSPKPLGSHSGHWAKKSWQGKHTVQI